MNSGVIVSVPYRGLIFLNQIEALQKKINNAFPSPIGDLYFSINKEIDIPERFQFPSPIGDLYFSIRRANLRDAEAFIVSVPYRGLIFLNSGKTYVFIAMVLPVSVPYRGLIFLNW